MVRTCSVYRCNSQFIKGGQVSFHLFPSDPVRRNLWITAVKEARKTNWNFIPGKFSCICSKHFSEDCFNTFGIAGVLKTRSLKSDSIPTIFHSSPPKAVQRQLDFKPSTSSYVHHLQEPVASTAQDILQSGISPLLAESKGTRDVQKESDVESVSDSSTITAESNNPIIVTSLDSISSTSPIKNLVKTRLTSCQTEPAPPTSFAFVGISRSQNLLQQNKIESNHSSSTETASERECEMDPLSHSKPKHLDGCLSDDFIPNLISPGKTKWKISKGYIVKQKKAIKTEVKTLQQQRRRLKARIITLKMLMGDLNRITEC